MPLPQLSGELLRALEALEKYSKESSADLFLAEHFKTQLDRGAIAPPAALDKRQVEIHLNYAADLIERALNDRKTADEINAKIVLLTHDIQKELSRLKSESLIYYDEEKASESESAAYEALKDAKADALFHSEPAKEATFSYIEEQLKNAFHFQSHYPPAGGHADHERNNLLSQIMAQRAMNGLSKRQAEGEKASFEKRIIRSKIDEKNRKQEYEDSSKRLTELVEATISGALAYRSQHSSILERIVRDTAEAFEGCLAANAGAKIVYPSAEIGPLPDLKDADNLRSLDAIAHWIRESIRAIRRILQNDHSLVEVFSVRAKRDKKLKWDRQEGRYSYEFLIVPDDFPGYEMLRLKGVSLVVVPKDETSNRVSWRGTITLPVDPAFPEYRSQISAGRILSKFSDREHEVYGRVSLFNVSPISKTDTWKVSVAPVNVSEPPMSAMLDDIEIILHVSARKQV